MYRELTIDNTIVDLPVGDFPFSITYEIDDSGIIKAARAKRSIELPSTTTNDTMFEDWYAISNVNPNASTLKPFVFTYGGITLFTGQAELQSAPLNSNRYRFKAKGYKVDLYGNNADWFLQLEDTKIGDLDWQDTIYNTAFVINGFFAEYDSGDFYGFTLVKWKEWTVAGQVDIDEFTPFLFIRSIIDKALDTIGYQLSPSVFLDSDNFKRLMLLVPIPERYPAEFSEDYINVKAEEPLSAAVIGAYTPFVFGTQTKTPPVGPNPYNNITGNYTALYTGYYEVRLRYQVRNVTAAASFSWIAEVNNVIGSIPDVPHINDAGVTVDTDYNFVSRVVFLNAGDFINVNGTVLAGTFDHYFELEVIGEAEVAFGSLIRWEYLLRDWKVNDLILGLQQMFNLRFETDTQLQRLLIEPADDYLYQQRTPTLVTKELRQGFYTDNTDDKTQNLDLNKDAELYNVNNIAQITQLQYITDGETEEAIEENEPLGIYSALYTLPPNRFNPETNIKENPFFAKTIHTIDNTIKGASSELSIQVPLIYPQDYFDDPTATEANYEVAPRILYFAGFRGGGAFPQPLDGTITYAFTPVDVAWPCSFMVNYNSELDPSLSFSNETVQGVTVTGLLESHYLQEFARNRIGKRLECRYFWDRLSILGLTFRNKLYLDAALFVLQKVDGYQPLKDVATKTILLLDQRPEQEDVDAIGNTLLQGIVNTLV